MTDQMSTDALELYCRNRAKSIGELTEYDRILLMDVSVRLCALQAENAEKDKEIERLKAELLEAREDYMASEMEREQGLAALSRVEAERDAAKPSAEVLEAIDELIGFARPIMSIATWLGYVNVLNEWRGAQGEG